MKHSAILGFGVYLPKYRIRTSDIARHWQQDADALVASLGVHQKSVAGRDEDTFTMAFEAARLALDMSGVPSSHVSAIFVGSESHPYAVKPTSGMLVAALTLDSLSHAADLEFACKAGTAGLQMVDSFVRSGQVRYGLAIGTDTAQGKPGDALEYTAAAGAAAFVVGPDTHKNALCRIEKTLSFTTDTPDFWRAKGEQYPRHAGRFTGEPGYFEHVRETIRAAQDAWKLDLAEIGHVVFHMPNAKFPMRIAKEFGITKGQMSAGFVVPQIGNTYSACSLIGLVSVLEKVKKGQRILVVSYGSGSGCDAILMTAQKDGKPLPVDVREPTYLDYSQYLEHTGALSV
ncbi:hydroxymethylglutaryl-CoA synthase [Candidatus Kaiserbacteria bacterium]|nr:hydroxymethylglutaryl-CoA synthase [Candidatus Kaiserbacteria bacterium]